jgi:hypothetical protein
MYFNIKNILKNNYNYTFKYTLNRFDNLRFEYHDTANKNKIKNKVN